MLGLRKSVVLLVALVLSGCAGGINGRYLTGNEKESDIGIIVVTHTTSGQYRNSQNADVLFRSLDDKIKGSLNDPSSSPKYLISGERLPDSVPATLVVDAANPIGGVNVLRLPAGEYEFYSFNSHKAKPLPTALVRSSFEARGKFSAKFSVKPGSVTYVGRLHFDYPADARVTFKIVDKSVDDIAVFKREYEQFKVTSVDIAVPAFNH